MTAATPRPTRRRHVVGAIAMLGVVGCATGCGGDGGTEPPPPPPNRAPVPVATIPSLTVTAGEMAEISLSDYFSDPDGDSLAYTATTSNESIASPTVSGSTLTIAGVAQGTATVTVAARDPGGLSAAQTLTATVERANQAPVSVDSLAARTLHVGDTVTVDVSAYFRDPDGDTLTYAAASSSDSVAGAWMSDSLLTVVGVGVGTATVRVTATDPGGLPARLALEVSVVPSLTPTTVTITPDTVELSAPGDTVRLTAKVRDQHGRVMAGVAAAWTSSKPAIVAVDSSGLVTVAGYGTATVSATAGQASGTARITVVNPDRAVLETLYHATSGPHWRRDDNWLTDAPLGDWYGVATDVPGRVARVTLRYNDLSGPIPRELGDLANLGVLYLDHNDLSGPIPPGLGNLARLEGLVLHSNALSGPIPAELGNLANLTQLRLYSNALSGPIPLELGNLARLEGLVLHSNALSGPIPAELGNLANLTELRLYSNALSGPIPAELGNLANLTELRLYFNALTGPIPAELGNLSNLRVLSLNSNDLSGPVPAAMVGMTSLRRLDLSHNLGLKGPLPDEMTAMGSLETLLAGDTDLCAPSDPGFQIWLQGISIRRIAPCVAGGPTAAYLTQAVQSRQFPVPLVADEGALLRVFPTANRATSEGIPAVRARFFVNGRETHVEYIPGKASPIPTAVDESTLSKSANAEIPAEVIRPGLEMVIEVDPQGTLDSGLGVATRIPETGRLAVDVKEMPLFDLTLIPFIWRETHNSSIVELIGEMASDPEDHEMLYEVRTLMPVQALDISAHEPVLTSTNYALSVFRETVAIRALEGGAGYYQGMMAPPVTGAGGVGLRPGRSSFSVPNGSTMAHEIGHNMSLWHAPCGGARFTDLSFPYSDGSIGAWGYDFRDGNALVWPSTRDLMSYCGPKWISDYHFTNAFRFRLSDAARAGPPDRAPPQKSLLVWGGAGSDGTPFLEPAFVVGALPELPKEDGPYRLTGQAEGGDELFSLAFAMPEVADGDGSSSFAFVLPVRSGWEGNLATITLTGPGGSFTLDGASDLPMVILRNPRTGQVRGFLRNRLASALAEADAVGAPGAHVEVLFSRGIPDDGRDSR